MNTKLTLTIDKNIIEKAKKHANEKRVRLSDMVKPQTLNLELVTIALTPSFSVFSFSFLSTMEQFDSLTI